VVVKDASSVTISQLLSNLSASASEASSRQGTVAIFGQCGDTRVSQLLTGGDPWRIEMKRLFIPTDGDARTCGHLAAIIGGELTTSAFARWHVGVVHVLVKRTSRAWSTSEKAGTLLRRYVATLEAIIRYDVTTHVIVHFDDVFVPSSPNYSTLCRDPFGARSRDLADVMTSTIYSFTDVYRNLYQMPNVYNVLYLRSNL